MPETTAGNEKTETPQPTAKVMKNAIETQEFLLCKKISTFKEEAFGVPAYASSFYISNDNKVVAVDNNYQQENTYDCYELTSSGWKKKAGKTAFAMCRQKNKDISFDYITDVIQRDNGDYIFSADSIIYRIQQDGTVRYKADTGKILKDEGKSFPN